MQLGIGDPPSLQPHGLGTDTPMLNTMEGFSQICPPTIFFLCKEFKMNLLRHLQGDRIKNSFVLKPPAWCGLMDGAYLNQAWKYLVL